jgi:tetratricopeptide (TPR) repeat protein
LRTTLRLARRYEPRLDVYYQFLQARALQSRRDPPSLLAAAELFTQVVDRDPQYAAAWAGIATALANAARLRPGEGPASPRIAEAARRAHEIDEQLPESRLAMAMLLADQLQWQPAEAAFRQAIDLDPSVPFAYTEFVLWVLLPQQRYDEALAILRRAAIRDPISLDVRRVMALVQVDSGRYDEAIESSRWVLERRADFPFAATWLARALVLSGRPEESLAVIDQHKLGPGYRGYVYAVLGRRDEAEAIASDPKAAPMTRLLVYGGLGDTDRALAAMEQLATMNPWRAATWMTRPEVAILRAHPRYIAIRNRLGLPR